MNDELVIYQDFTFGKGLSNFVEVIGAPETGTNYGSKVVEDVLFQVAQEEHIGGQRYRVRFVIMGLDTDSVVRLTKGSTLHKVKEKVVVEKVNVPVYVPQPYPVHTTQPRPYYYHHQNKYTHYPRYNHSWKNHSWNNYSWNKNNYWHGNKWN